eukprot:6174683-Pleurochrysis_carterae.AAC.1
MPKEGASMLSAEQRQHDAMYATAMALLYTLPPQVTHRVSQVDGECHCSSNTLFTLELSPGLSLGLPHSELYSRSPELLHNVNICCLSNRKGTLTAGWFPVQTRVESMASRLAPLSGRPPCNKTCLAWVQNKHAQCKSGVSHSRTERETKRERVCARGCRSTACVSRGSLEAIVAD